MGTISPQQSADGESIEAADINTPINQIAAVINGGIDSDNIEAGGVVPNSLTSGAGASWTWQTWTPSWTNLSLGNGTETHTYIQMGKTVIVNLHLVFGSTTSISGNVSVDFPVAPATSRATQGYSPLGKLYLVDAGTKVFNGTAYTDNSSTSIILAPDTANTTYSFTGAAVQATIPHTWANTDIISGFLIYEAA